MTEPAAQPNAALQDIARAHREGRFAEALGQIERLAPADRNQFDVLAYQADLHGRLGDHEREIELLERLIEQRPDSAGLWVAKANALKTVGRAEEAIAAARQAIELHPGYGKAWWLLSELKTFRFSDEDVSAMQEAVRGEPAPADLLNLHFALGKAHEDRGEPETAFEHFAAGNRLRAPTSRPGTAISQFVDRAIATFTPQFFAERKGHGADSEEAIFIVGLPRSGTSLIEQILASHSEVEGLSELPLIPQINAEIARDPGLSGRELFEKIAALDAASSAKIGRDYLQRARAFRRTDRPRFIDKLPANWRNIGLIRLVLPNARIIDARRHPLAVGFSNFKQNYDEGFAFSYSLETIGRYYRDYLRLMSHFERAQRGAVHRLVNERLIDDFEGEVRGLLDYLGLPFDPACLEFHRTERAVRTPSAEQVRRPVSRAGVGQWRTYEPWLGELKAALGPALEGWDAPPGDYRDDEQA